MNPALLDQTTVDIAAANCLFRAQGSVMKFPGFTIVYTEGQGGQRRGERLRQAPARRARGGGPETRLPHAGAEVYPAAAALLRGLPRPGTGRKRHRPPQHLCDDPEHDPGPGIRPSGKREVHPHRSRHPRDGSPREELSPDPRRGLHRIDGDGSRPDRGGEDRSVSTRSTTSTYPSWRS